MVTVNIVFFLITDRTKKRVTEGAEALRVEQRKVGPERGSLIEDHRRHSLVLRLFADEIDNPGNRPAAVEGRRRTFDNLDLFQIERRNIQKTQAA